ncbi:MAG: Ig-like domain-containing protein, partial [Candidatus Magasanikbacteria bacterium]
MFKSKLGIKGNVLIIVIVLGGASLFAILGLISYAVSENRASIYKKNREQALQIAESGIAYYRWHLAHNKEDYQDGTGVPGPYTHEYKNKEGKTIGYYTLTIVPPEGGSTIVTMYSTGWLASQPDSKRTLKIRLGFPAISDYAFLIDSDIIFSSTAYIHGKTHSNGRIYFDGVSDAPLSSAIEISGTGGPRSYWLYPVPVKDLASVQVKLEEIKTKSQANGLVWPYLPASGAYGYQLSFKNDGTVDVSKVISAPTCYSDACYDAVDFGPVTNYQIPTSSYIFVDDTVWVNGVVKGRATVATINNDMIVNGNLVYLAKDGTNVIGLMTNQNIVFPYNIPDPMEVNAAMVTVNGSIFRPKYLEVGASTKNIISTQNFYGSRVGSYAGGMKYLGCGSVCSGFENTNYFYDANLTYRPPAGFPVGSSYNLISWEEVRSTSTTDDFVPVLSIDITPASATIPANTSQQFTATALPANATIKNIVWSVLGGDVNGKISANGLYTAPDSAGSATVLAVSGGVIALASVTITSNGNALPTIASLPISTPASVSGTTGALSVLGHDDGGEANLRYTWSIISKPGGAADPVFNLNNSNAAKNTTVTYSMAGTYQFQVTITDANSLSVVSPVLSVTVNQTLTGVTVSPSPVTMGVDLTQQFAATAMDQFGQPITSPITYSWSADLGSITSGGLYTPNDIGTKIVSATSGGITGTVTVSVTAAATAPTVATTLTKVTGDNPTSDVYSVNANQLVLAFIGASRTSASISLSNTTISGGTLTWTRIGSVANVQSGSSVAIYKGVPSANLTNVRTRLSTSATRDFLKIMILDGAATTQGTFNRSNGSSGSTASLTINASSAKSLVFAAGWDINYNGSATTFTQTLLDNWNTGNSEQVWVQEITSPTASSGNVVFSRTAPATGGYNMAGVEIKSAGPGSQAPTIATPAAANPSTVTKTTSTLSVLGADDGGETSLTYTWNITSKPSGAPDPTFSVTNNTNAAKNNGVTFYAAGSYQFQVVIRDQ